MKTIDCCKRTDPPRAGDCGSLGPEFMRLDDCLRVFGLKKGTIYNLLAAGKIRGVSLREPGRAHGCRLIHVQSVRDFLTAQMNRSGN